jgi:hypothetical protein
MANNSLDEYINKSLALGFSQDQIRVVLKTKGWDDNAITTAFNKDQPAPRESTKFHASKILLYIGGLITIIAGVTYIGTSWSTWNAYIRILAIFIPLAISYFSGAHLFTKTDHKHNGIVFLVVGSLLFPLFLYVFVNELHLVPPGDNFHYWKGFIISFFSLINFLLLGRLYKHPSWTFYSLATILASLSYLLNGLGIESIRNPLHSWIMMVPSTFLFYICYQYEKSQEKSKALYAYLVGLAGLVLSFLVLFGLSYTHNYVVWLLLLSGGAYFGFGAWMEKRSMQAYGSTLYFIGAVLTFLSLTRLASEGFYISGLLGVSVPNLELVQWSQVIVGAIFIAIAWILNKTASIGLKDGSRYRELFYFMGPLFVLGGVYTLGLNGQHIFYETLLLVLSLVFILSSIYTNLKQFLYFGTLFLVVYIFSIGAEYFKDSIGWPLTLFVAGISSMLIGIVTDRLKKKFFKTDISK